MLGLATNIALLDLSTLFVLPDFLFCLADSEFFLEYSRLSFDIPFEC